MPKRRIYYFGRGDHRARLHTNSNREADCNTSGGLMGTANFGIAGLDWQQRVNWERMRNYRTDRAREHMK
jgi:hypothetical protein